MPRDWTEAELLKALALYYQIPFGAIDRNNPAVITLAAEIGRTPNAISLKMANLASLDPTILASGRKGMPNASSTDRRVFAQYAGQWDVLAQSISDAVSAAIIRRRETLIPAPTVAPLPRETEALAEVRVRRGQEFFRNAVLAAYRNSCCITGIHTAELLRASHIFPWRVHHDARLDPTNGLCLNALHDAAFDRGLVTIDEQRRLVVSPRVRSEMTQEIYAEWFARFEGVAIASPERLGPRLDAMAYHREQVYIG